MQDSAKRFYQVFFLKYDVDFKMSTVSIQIDICISLLLSSKSWRKVWNNIFLSCNSITWTNLLTIIILLHYVCHFSWYWVVIFESLRNTLMLLYMYPKNFVKVFILKVYFLLQKLNFFYVNTQQHDCLPYSLKNSKL